MKLIFQGHDYRYAVEQSLLAFFPTERPVYEGEDPHCARVTLTQGKKYHTENGDCYDKHSSKNRKFLLFCFHFSFLLYHILVVLSVFRFKQVFWLTDRA